jgi:Methylamine utilisation protein MauE
MDPLIGKTIAIGFCLLFFTAARHKLVTHGAFAAVLRDYQLIPPELTSVLAWMLIGLEFLLGFAWLFSGWVPVVAVSAVTAILLATYALAIAINLWRGRVFIDCGCGLSTSGAGGQHLSWGLVLRNIVLIGAAMLAAWPASTRVLGLADYATLTAALLAATFLYIASAKLLTNSAAISLWRDGDD